MTNYYNRDCKFCNEPIRMVEMNNGQWLPFDDCGKHTCESISVGSLDLPKNEFKKARENLLDDELWKRTNNAAERNSLEFWFWLLFILIAIVFALYFK